MPFRPAALSATIAGSIALSATADFYQAVEIGYWVTATDFGGASVTAYVVDVYLLSDDAWEGSSGSGDTLLNVYNWNTVPGAPTTYFQSFTGTGWIPTNLGGPFDTDALQQADSFVTIGGFEYDVLQVPGAGAGVGVDPNFGGNNAASPGVDAGWYNSSPPSLIGGAIDVPTGVGVLIGRFSSTNGVFSIQGTSLEVTWNQGPGTPGTQAGFVVVEGTLVLGDCNSNGIDDWFDIQDGGSDCNGNLTLDECESEVVAEASVRGMPTLANRLTLDTSQLPDSDADDVLIDIEASGEFAASAEFLTVLLDGQFLTYAFATNGLDCQFDHVTISVDAATWAEANLDGVRTLEVYASPAVDPRYCPWNEVTVRVEYPTTTLDCNANGSWDVCDIADGVSADVDADGVPDECQPDCDGDGYPDAWAVSEGLVPDCNANGAPDSCDITDGTSNDVEPNGVPDECKPDCNGNGLPDAYEIATGMVDDCNTNGRPDSCDIQDIGEADCDGDDVLDICAVADGLVPDCNANEIPDSCDLASGDSNDVDSDAVPDECQPDCDDDGLPDSWELATGLATDCNANGHPDNCDLADGVDEDSNGNGLPDQCDLARGDLDLDGCVGPADLGFLLSLWGFPNPPIGDLDGDGEIGPSDLGILLSNWELRCP